MKILRVLDKIEEYFVAILLAVMVTVAFVNVVTRYLIHLPLAFTEELEVNLFVWLTLVGTAIGVRKSAHLRVGIVERILPPSAAKVLFTVGYVVGIVVFVILIKYGIIQVMDQIQIGDVSESLGIPTWWYTIGVPIGSCLVIVRLVEAIYLLWKGR